MIEVETPEGIVEFPDGTPPETMKAALRKRFPPQPQSVDHRGTGGGRGTGLEAALIGARQGVTLGFGDEINAGVRAAGDWLGGKPLGEAYDERLAHERALLDQVRREDGGAMLAGEVGGAMLIPGGAMKAGASLPAQALRGGVVGAGTGAAYGFGDAEGGFTNRAEGAAVGGGIGALAGAAAPYAAAGVRKVVDARNMRKAVDAAAKGAPSPGALRATASGIYDAARARGIAIKAPVYQTFADDVATTMAAEGVHDVLTPRATAALREVEKIATGSVSWQSLEQARRVAGLAAKSVDPNERRLSGVVVGKIDDFMANLVDSDLDAGTAKNLGPELTRARDLWKRLRGNERLTAAMEDAGNAASGFENGLRIEYRKLVKDKRFFRTLSAPERDAVLAVVRGTPVGNILKRVSRLSFGAGAQTNFLGASVGSGAGAAIGGSVAGPAGAVFGAIAAPLVGRAAGKGAERTTLAAAERARALVTGGGLPLLPSPAQLPMVGNALSRFSRVPGMGAAGEFNR